MGENVEVASIRVCVFVGVFFFPFSGVCVRERVPARAHLLSVERLLGASQSITRR